MDDNDSTDIMKMIKDFQSGSEAYFRSSTTSIHFSTSDHVHSIFDPNCSISPKRPRLDDSIETKSRKTEAETSGSPWEWRRLKAEVVSLRARLSHQEAAVQQLHKIRRQVEEMFDKEKGCLEMQIEQDKQTIKQLEVRLDIARRNVQEAQEAQAMAEKELFQVKTDLEQKTVQLLQENAKLLEDMKRVSAHETVTSSKDIVQIAESHVKLKVAEERIAQLEEKLKEHRTIQQNLELRNIELQNLKIELEKLESEKALWKEGKQLVAKAAHANNLEKELDVARKTIATLRESLKEKLLLEEQVANMNKKLQHTETMEQQVTMLEAKQSELIHTLSEYESIGVNGGALALKRELNRLQHVETVLLAEEGQLRSKLDAVQRECQNLSKNYEEAKRVASDVTSSKEKLDMLVSRLQKKMLLVTRERDSYRQQLDLYEKDITTDGNNAITERIPALERTIDGYRELVTKLEADLQAAEKDIHRDECNKLKLEIQKLKEELKNRESKDNAHGNSKILHLKNNPVTLTQQQAEETQKALLRELEELRAKVANENADNTILQTQEFKELKRNYETKMAQLSETFKNSSQEYRQACYQLLGWRIDNVKEGRYKLSSLYAESPNDFLFFHVGEDGVDLLETGFSSTLGSFIEQHLQKQRSVPMFLNAVQSDLFAQQAALEDRLIIE